MNTTLLWTTIAAVALLGFAFKAVGPAVFGGRELPPLARSVMSLLPAALLAGFVIIELSGPGWSELDLTVTGGVASGIALRLCKAPLPPVMLATATATALLRWVS